MKMIQFGPKLMSVFNFFISHNSTHDDYNYMLQWLSHTNVFNGKKNYHCKIM